MKWNKIVGGFDMVLGLMMITMWGFFLISGQVPELETKPIEIALHIAAELFTGSLLFFAGFLLWRSHPMGKPIVSFALGMLAYTLIVSPGYYLAQGLSFVGIPFLFLLVVDLVCMHLIWKEKNPE